MHWESVKRIKDRNDVTGSPSVGQQESSSTPDQLEPIEGALAYKVHYNK